MDASEERFGHEGGRLGVEVVIVERGMVDFPSDWISITSIIMKGFNSAYHHSVGPSLEN